ncbi:MAG: DUF2147 domain-containing protein [Ferruginibacter sp.]
MPKFLSFYDFNLKKIHKTVIVSLLFLFPFGQIYGQSVKAADRICGKWENQEKTFRIQVYTQHNQFLAKIIWFSDTEGKPMSYWKDKRNPNPALRNRTIVGMSILRDLKYNTEKGSWENGKVYDSKHGKEWSASAVIDKHDVLKVRGYWRFKFLGKTMKFNRIK